MCIKWYILVLLHDDNMLAWEVIQLLLKKVTNLEGINLTKYIEDT